MRSLLSLMGLTVAIAGMVGLFAVKQGLEQSVDKTFQLIPGLTVMQPGAPVPLFSKLPVKWAGEIAEIEGVSVVNTQIIQRANLIEGKMSISPPTLLFGTDIKTRLQLKRGVYRESMKEGRFLRESDRGTGNAVVSWQIARRLNKKLGDDLAIDGATLKIVGIYHTGMMLIDVAVVLDLEKVREMTRFDPNSVSSFYLEKTDDDSDYESLKTAIENHFRGRHLTDSPTSLQTGIPLMDALLSAANQPSSSESASSAEKAESSRGETQGGDSAEGPLPIEVRSGNDWGEKLTEFSKDLDIFLLIMTSIGLTVAVLNIINTMLMSVTERIVEFGILKANGWSRRDVLKLITYESAIVGIIGGMLGAFCGWVATQGINSAWPDRIHLFASPGLLVFSVAFSTFVGCLGGLYPAVWAMRMMPMDAIRRG